jgi:hypothetical protein
MAKRDDDDLDVDDIADDSDDDDVVDEADEADEVEDADEDVEDAEDAEDVDDAEDDDGDDDDGASDDDEEAEEEPAKPVRKAKITGLTLTLIILNVLGAIGFLFLLMLDYERRQRFTHAGIQLEADVVGAGTIEDRKGATAGTSTLPVPRYMSGAELSSAVPGGPTVSGWEGGFDFLLYGDAVSDEVRKKLMSEAGEPVLTIEEEMQRLKTSLPAKIEEAARSIFDSAKGDADKRAKARFLLLPICFDTFQVDKLDKRIDAAQGAELDALLLDAGQRRIIADILNPVEIYRPGDIESKKPFIEKVGDLDVMTLEDVKNALTRRLDAAAKDKHDGETFFGQKWEGQPRWTVEKRQNAAFLLVSIAYARNPMSVNPKTPFEEQLLIPGAVKRAERVAGLYNFTTACSNYIAALEKLQDRVQTALLADREGFTVKVDNLDRQTDGFVDRYADAIQNIRDVQLNTRRAEERRKDLTQQKDKANKLYVERLAHVKDVEASIQKARAITAKDAEGLRKLQDELFEAQKVLADAAAINEQLLREIQMLNASHGASQAPKGPPKGPAGKKPSKEEAKP